MSLGGWKEWIGGDGRGVGEVSDNMILFLDSIIKVLKL